MSNVQDLDIQVFNVKMIPIVQIVMGTIWLLLKTVLYFKKKKAIQKIKSEKSISYGDARRLYNTANSQSTKTYASAVRSTASIGT